MINSFLVLCIAKIRKIVLFHIGLILSPFKCFLQAHSLLYNSDTWFGCFQSWHMNPASIFSRLSQNTMYCWFLNGLS